MGLLRYFKVRSDPQVTGMENRGLRSARLIQVDKAKQMFNPGRPKHTHSEVAFPQRDVAFPQRDLLPGVQETGRGKKNWAAWGRGATGKGLGRDGA